MKTTSTYRSYDPLADKADQAFQDMEKSFGPHIRCERGCSDCCHAVFGLFLIEAVHLKEQFEKLDSEAKKAALLRCNEADLGLKRLEKMLKKFEKDPRMQAYAMARERIRCPLLDENDECILYINRPITCRVYGIPTKVQGQAKVCGKSGFKRGEAYSTFDLDGIYRDLYMMTMDFLENSELGDPEKAPLMISVAKAISTPLDDLIYEIYGSTESDS
jgi:Fe-S-cluster containining protein